MGYYRVSTFWTERVSQGSVVTNESRDGLQCRSVQWFGSWVLWDCGLSLESPTIAHNGGHSSALYFLKADS